MPLSWPCYLYMDMKSIHWMSLMYRFRCFLYTYNYPEPIIFYSIKSQRDDIIIAKTENQYLSSEGVTLSIAYLQHILHIVDFINKFY